MNHRTPNPHRWRKIGKAKPIWEFSAGLACDGYPGDAVTLSLRYTRSTFPRNDMKLNYAESIPRLAVVTTIVWSKARSAADDSGAAKSQSSGGRKH